MADDEYTVVSLPQPSDSSIVVRRYMDHSKFKSMFETKTLYLSRLDRLDDPHEGTVPTPSVEYRKRLLRSIAAPMSVDPFAISSNHIYESNIQKNRFSTYVNCWRKGIHESKDMWLARCPNRDGVAVLTSYKTLADSIDRSILSIGEVTYLNYEHDELPSLSEQFSAFKYKRTCFAHEDEIRIVYIDKKCPDNFFKVAWPLESTVVSIYVNPHACYRYFDEVKSIVKKFVPCLEDKVRWSPLRTDSSR